VLLVDNAPPVVKTASLKLTRPELYYGEQTHEPIFVRTSQPEFNYPAGADNVHSQYEGKGGIPISSFPMRLAAALEFGDWKIALRLSENDPATVKFLRTLQDAYDANLEEATAAEEPKARAQREKRGDKLGADLPFSSEFSDDGNPTGMVKINFKRKAGGRDEKTGEVWRSRVDLVDAAGQRLDPVKVKVGGGSTVAVAFTINPFSTAIGAGISLRLEGVQVIERRDAPERSAEQLGFQKREGYVYVDDTGADSEATDGPTDESTDRIE
jgi:hypothetical protein